MAADAITLWRSLIVGGKVRTMRGNPTKTVAVIRFEATDGRPIAVYVVSYTGGTAPQIATPPLKESGESFKVSFGSIGSTSAYRHFEACTPYFAVQSARCVKHQYRVPPSRLLPTLTALHVCVPFMTEPFYAIDPESERPRRSG